METLKTQLSQLLLLVPPESFSNTHDARVEQSIARILEGGSESLLAVGDFKEVSHLPELKAILGKYPETPLVQVLAEYVSKLVQSNDKFFGEEGVVCSQILGVACLQLFIQANFTGPQVATTAISLLFPSADPAKLQADAISLLNIEGQQAYDLMQEPVFLILAELIFERLAETPYEYSLFNKEVAKNTAELLEFVTKGSRVVDPAKASLNWWRVRALQVHSSVVSEPPSIILSICGLLLNNSLVNVLAPTDAPELERLLQIQYLLEVARVHIQSSTEHAAVLPLTKAKTISELQVLLSGAKAKRTKYQSFFTSNLIVLAKSNITTIYDVDTTVPESFNLDSDLLLEKPQYESLEDLDVEIEQDTKRVRIDSLLLDQEDQEAKLLPIAMKQEDIPVDLKELDPNDQPTLNNLDNLQLLLRLTVLKQTSPANDPLVEEELMALVGRVLYATAGKVNWTIFSRALWERSLLETGKSRTIERGILQMTSLIEEMGIKIKTRIIPEAQQEDPNAVTALRLRFIHQLPLLPQWSMDAKLAEKYMSLGVLKSAIEIYERLQMHCEAALCYAAVDNEAEAEQILLSRLQTHPDDARAISILGDIRQDPSLWEKAWEVGRYAKAKASLSHYYYNQKNIELAVKNMFDCLSVNPLSYENWYFYGCCGLESQQFELASEAFTRCVSLDETNSYAWSNLASALLKLDKTKPAFNALKKAIRCGGENRKSWRIYENYMLVAIKLNEWNDVLLACRELIDIKKDEGDASIDIPVLEKLVEILVSEQYPTEEGARLTHFQSECIDLVCNVLPKVITSSARCWRIVARVELWRKRPWAALEYHEKAYRVMVHNPELESSEAVWNEVVDACEDLVSAFESLGELPGKHGAGDVVCKDWKYKARTTVRSLMSKGKDMWEDSPGWERLQAMKEDLSNSRN
ncbi:Essential for maintenance of the cell wall protein 1 [Candida viswanathii]|uniref:Essential for maintenance of the cell wall protein 1 n=1 Tax=Candida viswanathii TaxID=5486 RepID=A0A367XLY0_9ASCO|nr:Essential for maintenance of the cell wall protein 1 [Candida viswanathii]